MLSIWWLVDASQWVVNQQQPVTHPNSGRLVSNGISRFIESKRGASAQDASEWQGVTFELVRDLPLLRVREVEVVDGDGRTGAPPRPQQRLQRLLQRGLATALRAAQSQHQRPRPRPRRIGTAARPHAVQLPEDPEVDGQIVVVQADGLGRLQGRAQGMWAPSAPRPPPPPRRNAG